MLSESVYLSPAASAIIHSKQPTTDKIVGNK